MRPVCVGKCGHGLEGDLFTCGGCGGETAQGVDDRTSPRSVSCGDSGAVWALRQFREQQGSQLLLTHAHTTCGGCLGVDCVNLQMIHTSIKVCALRSRSLLMLLQLIFPWCCSSALLQLTPHIHSLSYRENETFVIWLTSICRHSHANDRLLISTKRP